MANAGNVGFDSGLRHKQIWKQIQREINVLKAREPMVYSHLSRILQSASDFQSGLAAMLSYQLFHAEREPQMMVEQQNAYIERYNRTVRYDWLAQYLFDSIEEVQDHATRWLWTYHHKCPNMAIGSITPKQKLALAA